jgi:hypothetical protein
MEHERARMPARARAQAIPIHWTHGQYTLSLVDSDPQRLWLSFLTGLRRITSVVTGR